VDDEATDLGFRTSYSTAVVVVVFLLFVVDVPGAPGRGAGSGLEGIFCDRDRSARSVNRPSLTNCACYAPLTRNPVGYHRL